MHAADVMAKWFNVDKAKALLGGEPEVGLQEGVARLCAWYRENRRLGQNDRYRGLTPPSMRCP